MEEREKEQEGKVRKSDHYEGGKHTQTRRLRSSLRILYSEQKPDEDLQGELLLYIIQSQIF